MMIKRFVVSLTTVLVLLGVGLDGAVAADASDRFSVRGLGATTCSKYLEQRNLNVDDSVQYAHWLTGFLTAYNWLQPDTYDIAPSDRYNQQGLLRYMDLYCGKNPTKKVIDVGRAFVKAVYDKRVKSGS